MVSALSLYFVLVILLAISEAVKETAGDEESWKTSVLSNSSPTSFFGPRQRTHRRKDHPNKVVNFLKHTVLVWATDIWHFCDFIIHGITFIGLGILFPALTVYFLALFGGGWLYFLLLVIGWVVVFAGTFHLFFHFVLKKNRRWSDLIKF